VFDLMREYDLPESVDNRTTFCGYVTSSSASRPGRAGDPQGLAEEGDRKLVLDRRRRRRRLLTVEHLH